MPSFKSKLPMQNDLASLKVFESFFGAAPKLPDYLKFDSLNLEGKNSSSISFGPGAFDQVAGRLNRSGLRPPSFTQTLDTSYFDFTLPPGNPAYSEQIFKDVVEAMRVPSHMLTATAQEVQPSSISTEDMLKTIERLMLDMKRPSTQPYIVPDRTSARPEALTIGNDAIASLGLSPRGSVFGFPIYFSPAALKKVRNFPEAKRSRRLHKKLCKRFHGEFRDEPAIFIINDFLLVHRDLERKLLKQLVDQGALHSFGTLT